MRTPTLPKPDLPKHALPTHALPTHAARVCATLVAAIALGLPLRPGPATAEPAASGAASKADAPSDGAKAEQGKPDPKAEPASGKSGPLTAAAIDGATFTPPGAGGAGDGKPGDGTAPAGEDRGKAEGGGKKAGKGGAKKGEAGEDDADRPDPLIVKTQILLDRARFFPGVVDGRMGENVEGALSAFATANGLPATKALDAAVWAKLAASGGGPVVRDYTITEADVRGPFTDRIPPKMVEQADLEAMGYTGPAEMLAERFHMSRAFLEELNPGKALDKAGTTILVAALDPMGTDKPRSKDLPRDPKVERVVVQKASRDVRAYGADGKLLGYYPASIGSTEKPAPSGDTKVKGVAFDPYYTYNPKYKFRGVKAKHKFSIPPGPNNPVGLVWIDLAIPSYGIHGTPEPAKIGKTESHGCIRLTNWNARDLAAHVARGARVEFKDE